MAETGVEIGVVGDLHNAWSAADVEYFNRAHYPLLLFTGDLGGPGGRDAVRIAKSISHIARDVLVMPGNNDVQKYEALAAELVYRHARSSLLRDIEGVGQRGELPSTSTAACGYSTHVFVLGGRPLTVVAGRPFSMGGPTLTFPEAVERTFGLSTLEESQARLCALLDSVSTQDVLFLAHNGPTGLGQEPNSIWGNDFRIGGGDWGDSDLANAVAYAERIGLRVRAVVAGHMHSPTRSHRDRVWQLVRDGILYVNAARVPRIFEDRSGRLMRHHVALCFEGDRIHAEARFVDATPG